MTLESIIEALLENYGACDTLEELEQTIPYMKETARVNIEPYTWLEIEKELTKGISVREVITEEVFELNNDKIVIEEISSPEIPMPNLALDDKFAVSMGIAVNGTSANDKVVIEGAKVHGFLCVINANFVTEYYTTASAVADKIGICRRTRVPKLKMGDKFGNIEILYINHK